MRQVPSPLRTMGLAKGRNMMSRFVTCSINCGCVGTITEIEIGEGFVLIILDLGG